MLNKSNWSSSAGTDACVWCPIEMFSLNSNSDVSVGAVDEILQLLPRWEVVLSPGLCAAPAWRWQRLLSSAQCSSVLLPREVCPGSAGSWAAGIHLFLYRVTLLPCDNPAAQKRGACVLRTGFGYVSVRMISLLDVISQYKTNTG